MRSARDDFNYKYRRANRDARDRSLLPLKDICMQNSLIKDIGEIYVALL